ncbi:MAG: hypothetical protein PGN33_10940 [Methylobacterium radiotolerans]
MPTILDPHRDHLEARWQAGCRNAAELARELIRSGAAVHPRVVRDWAMKRRRASSDVLDDFAEAGERAAVAATLRQSDGSAPAV